jgi:hypothetical protein
MYLGGGLYRPVVKDDEPQSGRENSDKGQDCISDHVVGSGIVVLGIAVAGTPSTEPAILPDRWRSTYENSYGEDGPVEPRSL